LKLLHNPLSNTTGSTINIQQIIDNAKAGMQGTGPPVPTGWPTCTWLHSSIHKLHLHYRLDEFKKQYSGRPEQ
jgi:hypothetical protein